MKWVPLEETAGWRRVREVGVKFAEDNCTLIAAAVSFFALLSVIPLMLLAVAVLGAILSSEKAQQVVMEFAGKQLPGLEPQIAEELGRLIAGQEWTGGLGLLGLLWASQQVFLNLEVALNLAWHAQHKRTLLQRRLLSLAMTLFAGVPLALSLLLTFAIATLRGITVPVFGWRLGAIPVVWNLAGELVPLLLSILSFTAIYRWVPHCSVRWKSAFIGGVAGALLWETAKRVFAFYVGSLANLGRIYGPFAGIIGLILWIYYSALILLLGAEIAAVAQSVHPIVQHPETTEAEERLREVDSTGV